MIKLSYSLYQHPTHDQWAAQDCLEMPLIPKYSMSELSHFIAKDNYIHLKKWKILSNWRFKKSKVLHLFLYDIWDIQNLDSNMQLKMLKGDDQFHLSRFRNQM